MMHLAISGIPVHIVGLNGHLEDQTAYLQRSLQRPLSREQVFSWNISDLRTDPDLIFVIHTFLVVHRPGCAEHVLKMISRLELCFSNNTCLLLEPVDIPGDSEERVVVSIESLYRMTRCLFSKYMELKAS